MTQQSTTPTLTTLRFATTPRKKTECNWNDDFWDVTTFEDDTLKIFFVKILEHSDPRAQTPDLDEAKKKEVECLKARDICEKVNEVDVPNGASILGGRFVLTLKHF